MTTHNRPNYQNTSFASTFSRHSRVRSNESLIGDFVCMLSNTKLVPGHLYCRKNSLAFYANAMRDDTKILLSFDDVIRIKKPTHVAYLDNAIEIVCKDNKNYTFVQFPNREAAYNLLIRVFRAFIKTSKEARDSKSNSPSQILGQASLRHLFSAEKGHSGYSSPKSESKSEESSDPTLSNSPNATQYLTEEQQRDEEGFYKTIETVLPVSVDQAFDLYFSDHPVFTYGEHLAHLGAYNVKVGKWKMNEQRHRQERRIHCNKALHGIFYDTEMGSKSIQSYCKGEEGFVNAIFTGDCCMKDMLEERVHEDKKKEHELWVQYINQNKLFGRRTTELILEKIKELHSRKNPAENSQAEEDPKSLVIDPKDIAHGDTLIDSLKLPATPSPSIDTDFSNGGDKPDAEGRTCAEILDNKTAKSQIKPIILAESLEAIDDKQHVEKEGASQEEQEIQVKSKKREPGESNQDSKFLKSPNKNELINLSDKEKPMNLSSLSEVDQQNSSITNTGIFDSPVHSTQKGLKDIQHKTQETNIAKKLSNEMEKVKDFKAKVEEKIVSSKPVLSQHEHHLSTSLAQARRMTRILFIFVIVLFLMFVGTTLHLSSKLSNLQSSCNLSSA